MKSAKVIMKMKQWQTYKSSLCSGTSDSIASKIHIIMRQVPAQVSLHYTMVVWPGTALFSGLRLRLPQCSDFMLTGLNFQTKVQST